MAGAEIRAVLSSSDGMAWELEMRNESKVHGGRRFPRPTATQARGQSEPVAKKWADRMTEHYDQLAGRGDLRRAPQLHDTWPWWRRCSPKSTLTEKAGCELPGLDAGIDAEDARIAGPHAG